MVVVAIAITYLTAMAAIIAWTFLGPAWAAFAYLTGMTILVVGAHMQPGERDADEEGRCAWGDRRDDGAPAGHGNGLDGLS